MDTKVCSYCREDLPLNKFYRRKDSRDNYRGQCKFCDDHPEKRVRGIVHEKIVTEKVCSRCEGDPQPLENFYKSKDSKDGHAGVCKKCKQKREQERLKDPAYKERKRLIDKKSREKKKREDPEGYKKKQQESQRRRKEKDPEYIKIKTREYRKRKISEDPDWLKKKATSEKKSREKAKQKDPEGFKRKQHERYKRHKEKQLKDNPEEYRKRQCEIQKRHREKMKKENPDLLKEREQRQRQKYKKKYPERHLESKRKANRKYKENNPKRYKQSQREYDKRKRSDPAYKLYMCLSTLIRQYLKSKGAKKSDQTARYINCDAESFTAYIKTLLDRSENKLLKLENHGKDWHIDHKIPAEWFDWNSKIQIKYASYYKNLQPKAKADNCAKRDHYADVNGDKKMTRQEWLDQLKNGTPILQLMQQILDLDSSDMAYLNSIK